MLTREDDIRVLRMLDLRDHEGLSGRVIGKRLGTSKGAVAGAVNRIYNSELPCACTKPENKTGGMPRGWWK